MSFVVCVLKKDDIFIDWSTWSIVGAIVLPILWFECGPSSSQTRTNDIRNVVLLVVDPSSIHHYIFWSDQCYHLVHIVVEFHFMEILINCYWAHRRHPYLLHDVVGHQASVGNLCKHFFVFRSWSICLEEISDYLWFTCIWWKLPPWIRESSFASFGIIPS